ncbi:hypothetical protein B0H19DRAFT_481486 [Mycena capillaripes]|nr:hypothetical protein B0H19DRAFT_481486 [Mycena capillaripes]
MREDMHSLSCSTRCSVFGNYVGIESRDAVARRHLHLLENNVDQFSTDPTSFLIRLENVVPDNGYNLKDNVDTELGNITLDVDYVVPAGNYRVEFLDAGQTGNLDVATTLSQSDVIQILDDPTGIFSDHSSASTGTTESSTSPSALLPSSGSSSSGSVSLATVLSGSSSQTGTPKTQMQVYCSQICRR